MTTRRNSTPARMCWSPARMYRRLRWVLLFAFPLLFTCLGPLAGFAGLFSGYPGVLQFVAVILGFFFRNLGFWPSLIIAGGLAVVALILWLTHGLSGMM